MIDRHRHRLAQLRIVERRLARHQRVRREIGRRDLADRVGHLALHVLQHRHGQLIREGHVELAGDKGEQLRRAVRDDRPFDRVEIGQPLLPVIRVLRDLDRLVRLELDELERPGADRVLPHLRRRDVARIDRREPGGEEGEERRLRPLQVKRRLIVVVGGDVVEIGPPRLAGVEAQFFLRLALQQIPGAFDVGGGERLAVMPFDALVQFEGQILAVLAPGPALGEVGDDIVEPVLLLVLVEDDEVVEDRHHRRHDRDRALFVDRHVGGAVAVIDPQRAARISAPSRTPPATSGGSATAALNRIRARTLHQLKVPLVLVEGCRPRRKRRSSPVRGASV